MIPVAKAYMAAYDEAARYVQSWRREMAEGRAATSELLTTMRTWLPLAQRDVPGFDSSDYGDSPSVAAPVAPINDRRASRQEPPIL